MTTAHRVGIIGTGAIAGAHVEGYRVAGAEVVAICDTNAETLARRQTAWKIPTGYSDYREILADPEVEAVSICTPNASHHPMTLAAARAGKHVMCEKPASLNLDLAQEMIDVCAAEGIVYQVGHHLRSWAAASRAQAMIGRGDIGKVTYARFRQAHDWGGSPTVRGVFGSTAHSGGGTLLDNGCHLFDLARYLCGDVADVFARIATRKYDIEVEDTAMSSLGFASGALGHVEVAWTATGWHEGFWIDGTDGSIEVDNRVGGANVLTHRFRSGLSNDWSLTDTARYELQGLDAHSQHAVNFLAAIDGTREVVCSGADGLEAVRLVLASYESVALNRPVRLRP